MVEKLLFRVNINFWTIGKIIKLINLKYFLVFLLFFCVFLRLFKNLANRPTLFLSCDDKKTFHPSSFSLALSISN